jgi:hypothetical protein
MKLEITDEWLLSFDDKTPEPSGYVTPNERAEMARRKEGVKPTVLRISRVRKTKKRTFKPLRQVSKLFALLTRNRPSD